LLFLTVQNTLRASDQDLIALSEWIVRHEEEIHKSRKWAFDRWLLGIAHDPPPSPRERLGESMAALDLNDRADELKDWVELIGNELAGTSPS
jgi:hypothetical protein